MPLQPNTIWKRLKAGIGYAFAVSPHKETWQPGEVALMERIALKLVKRGMAQPAILFLESWAPLNFLGSQTLHALTPLLGLVCDPLELERMAEVLEKREGIAVLIGLIEQKAEGEQRKP